MTGRTMEYNADTRELACYAPADNEILRINDIDMHAAHKIHNSIQEAFALGRSSGVNEAVQHMNILARA